MLYIQQTEQLPDDLPEVETLATIPVLQLQIPEDIF